jgi:hypothetical protein
VVNDPWMSVCERGAPSRLGISAPILADDHLRRGAAEHFRHPADVLAAGERQRGEDVAVWWSASPQAGAAERQAPADGFHGRFYFLMAKSASSKI